ncbi:MAG: AAA family ATPase [Anaerolineae bacterium]|nr:AAA family ATPase [Anaerolineae bacterium]
MNATNNEGVHYINVVIKRLWLIILVTVVAGGLTFALSSTKEPTYEAHARLLIGNVIDSANPNLSIFDLSERLAVVYVELVRSRDNLDSTIAELNLDIDRDELSKSISTHIIPDTPILVISATYKDPEVAAAIANRVAEGLIARAPSNLTEQEQNRLELISQQIDDLETQIANARSESDELLRRIDDAQQIGFLDTESLLVAQYNQVSDRIATSQATLAQLLDTYLSLTQRVNTLEVLEDAQPILEESGISPLIIAVAGAIVGLILSVSLVLFMEYTNSTIRNEFELRMTTDLPMLAGLPKMGSIKQHPQRYVITRDMPNSSIAESFRTLRTGLLFAKESSADETWDNRSEMTRVAIVASPNKREGRSFVAVNLALSMAETGARVLLIDSNIRHPMLHLVFGLDNEAGLTTAIKQAKENPKFFQKNTTDAFKEAINVNELRQYGSLDVITCGTTTADLDPTIIGFENIERILERLIELGKYHIILFDSPPTQDFADSYTLAAKTNATMLLVFEAGRTSRDDARQVREQLTDMGIPIAGAILNKQ